MYSNTQHVYGSAKPSKLDLMGIRFLNEPGDGAGAGGDAAAQATTAASAGTGAADSNAPWTKENFDPERAWRLTENLRTDLAEQKTKTETAIAAAAEKAKKDTLAEFSRLLSGGEAEETDPEKLKAKVTDLSSQIQTKDGALTTAQAAVKSGQVATQVAILAPGLGASARLLLNNEAFKSSIASVEPTDEAALTSAITKALQANAALQATPSRSGSGEHQGATVQSLEAQLAAAQQKGDKTESIRLKMAIAASRRRSKA